MRQGGGKIEGKIAKELIEMEALSWLLTFWNGQPSACGCHADGPTIKPQAAIPPHTRKNCKSHHIFPFVNGSSNHSKRHLPLSTDLSHLVHYMKGFARKLLMHADRLEQKITVKAGRFQVRCEVPCGFIMTILFLPGASKRPSIAHLQGASCSVKEP